MGLRNETFERVVVHRIPVGHVASVLSKLLKERQLLRDQGLEYPLDGFLRPDVFEDFLPLRLRVAHPAAQYAVVAVFEVGRTVHFEV